MSVEGVPRVWASYTLCLSFKIRPLLIPDSGIVSHNVDHDVDWDKTGKDGLQTLL